ncbi:aspartyl/glutamyl-tRNA(Asn/Gln) amidotransferasesubunit B [Striga asiatica]|uniref:Aspartyl/glutamyl-tRNA(Asn/Gln) amidotransferasesubunit B n=1 Tax=Striga asiatica TaxID=4170 RepID=A0A5A7QRS4_STRAF|nr:aspartyl/glutamyl-tRNA(Asn/Gln) amidotransferasesubunit B [Striga asiatica]
MSHALLRIRLSLLKSSRKSRRSLLPIPCGSGCSETRNHLTLNSFPREPLLNWVSQGPLQLPPERPGRKERASGFSSYSSNKGLASGLALRIFFYTSLAFNRKVSFYLCPPFFQNKAKAILAICRLRTETADIRIKKRKGLSWS